MADRVVENSSTEVPEIPEVLESALLCSLDDAKEKMTNDKMVVPFTALVVKENLFIETHPGMSPTECFSKAAHTVQNARGADAYAFCYDGYVDLDDGSHDALIAEGGLPGEDTGYAVCYLYERDEDGEYTFSEEAAYVGEAPNFMVALKKPGEYEDDEVNSRYEADENGVYGYEVEEQEREQNKVDLGEGAPNEDGGIDWSDLYYA